MVEPRLLGLELAPRLLLLALALALLAQLLLLLLDLGQVVRGELELVDAPLVVDVGDADVHGGAEAGDRLARLGQPGDGRGELVRAQRAHEVVGLGVVGAQHQLGEVADHLGALLGGVVHGPVGARLHGLAVAHHGLQRVLHLCELGLVGDGVVEGVAVLVDADLLEQRLLLGDDDLGARRGELVLGAGELRARLEDLLLDAGELGAVLLDLLRQLDRLGALQVLDPLLEAGVLGLELLDATLAAECHDRCPFPAWRLTLRVRSDYTRRSTETGFLESLPAGIAGPADRVRQCAPTRKEGGENLASGPSWPGLESREQRDSR